jgi:hypothetical protein
MRGQVFDADAFRALYSLLSVDQTVDDAGAAVDCGVRCEQFCCRPGQTTKYLLPGERNYIADALAQQGVDDDDGLRFTSLGYFDTIIEPMSRPCACMHMREYRTFNCRVFPFSPRIDVDTRRVVGLKKGSFKYLEPCWITTPAPQYEENAVRAWQMVLDDTDNRMLFARLSTLWEWHKATERGEEPGHVLTHLLELDQAPPDELWPRAARFFSRSE